MVFALNRTSTKSKPQSKSSPLAGWLGRKGAKEDAGALPEIDIAAGLIRALRSTVNGTPEHGDFDNGSVRDALGIIESTLFSIDKIRDILEQTCEIAISAQGVEDAGGRALLAESYDEHRLSIASVIENLDERASALIGKHPHHVDVKLGGKARYSVSPARLDISETGLNLPPPCDAFATFEEITETLQHLDFALKKADRTGAAYCRDAQFLIARMTAAVE